MTPFAKDIRDVTEIRKPDAYAINRGVLTSEECRGVIDEYRARRRTTAAFAEWFTIDPPYAGGFKGYAPGEYVNGAICPLSLPAHAGDNEIYNLHMRPFEYAVKGGCDNIMTCYNLVDGIPGIPTRCCLRGIRARRAARRLPRPSSSPTRARCAATTSSNRANSRSG